ncbi:MAG: hypothetical protein HFG50_16125 [Lachnospiraceae bacterium]|jgi:hypothetical protein|nr:hypothetical protein [Lachnospiraceae bacterium]
MMRRNDRTGKRLRLTPLILGGYAAFLGFGLIVIGLAEVKEGIGIVRLLIGLGMAGFGLLGLWDGVRDLIKPDKKSEQVPVSQFILTDTLNNTEEAAKGKSEADTWQTEEHIKSFWQQLQREQMNQMRNWHQILVIFGESWHDEHKFFSARDVELAIDGIHEGKYTKAVLEWGIQALDFFPGIQNDLMVIWCTNNTGKGGTRFLAKEGTVTQVKFWMSLFLKESFFKETSGWADITEQIEKANRKGKKKHG